MRVLLSVYAISPTRGGETGNSWKLACALAERGIDVDVLCTPPSDADAVLVGMAPPRLRVLPVGTYVPPIDPCSVVDEYWQYLRWQRRAVTVALDAMTNTRYDLVHHYSWGSLVWGSPLWKLGLPMLFGPVGAGVVADRSMRASMTWRGRLLEEVRAIVLAAMRWNPMARTTVRRARSVVQNAATQVLVERMGGEVDSGFRLQDTLASEWFDGDVIALEGRRPRSVLWVGRFMAHKGPNLALEVCAALPPDVRLTMVGDGPDLEWCRALARQLGVSDRVEFTGRVPHDEVRRLAAEHAIFLFTSIRDTFGGQVAEAAALGTPVVAIRQHGVRDHLSDSCGVLVEVGDVASTVVDLADGVLQLLNDPQRWAIASSAAREVAMTFTVDHVVAATVASYERLVRESDGG